MLAGNDACAVTVPYVLLALMVCHLSRPSFERFFINLLHYSLLLLLWQWGNIKRVEGTRVWGCHCVPILRTAPAFNVVSLFSRHKTLSLYIEMLAWNLMPGIVLWCFVVKPPICWANKTNGLVLLEGKWNIPFSDWKYVLLLYIIDQKSAIEQTSSENKVIGNW